jgi:hypothetical protein
MTRAEKATLREQRLKATLAAKGRELAQVQAQNRAAERVKRDRRRQRVGTLADAAGLLIWDETTLAGLFQILATLRETPDPVAVLASLLTDPGPLDAGSVDGMAHPADGAAPAGAVVAVAG